MKLRYSVGALLNSEISPARFVVTIKAPDEAHAKATALWYVKQVLPIIGDKAVLDLGNHLECELTVIHHPWKGFEFVWTEARQRTAI